MAQSRDIRSSDLSPPLHQSKNSDVHLGILQGQARLSFGCRGMETSPLGTASLKAEEPLNGRRV